MIIRGSYMALNISTPIAFFIFFVLVGGVNVALRLLRVSWALRPAELVLIYIMMIIAATVPTKGFTEALAAQDHGSLLLRYARERLGHAGPSAYQRLADSPRPGDDQVFF